MPRRPTRCEKVKARAAFAYRNAIHAEMHRKDAASFRMLLESGDLRRSGASEPKWRRLMIEVVEELAEIAEWYEIHWFINVGPFDEVRG